MTKATHSAYALTANATGEQRTEPVSIPPYCLMTDVGAAFEQQVPKFRLLSSKRTYVSATSQITSD